MFVAPFAVLFTLCFVVPILVSVRASFFRTHPKGGGLYGGGGTVNAFAGLDNFREVLTSSHFWAGLGRVMLFGAFQIPIMIGGALVLALLLDSGVVRRVAVFRLGYFLPFAIPGVVAALVWMYLYSPQFSPINEGLHAVSGGHLGIDFFGHHVILASMANMTTWTFTGYNMLIFLAALQAIPTELYEAARIDGATGLSVVRHIKVPLVSRALMLSVLLSIIGTVQLFTEPTVLAARNTWMGGDYTPMMLAYNTMNGTISPSGSGPASAVSIVMALIAGVLAFGYARLQKIQEA